MSDELKVVETPEVGYFRKAVNGIKAGASKPAVKNTGLVVLSVAAGAFGLRAYDNRNTDLPSLEESAID